MHSWEGQFIDMTSVEDDVVIRRECTDILDLLHNNIDTVWEKAKVTFVLHLIYTSHDTVSTVCSSTLFQIQ